MTSIEMRIVFLIGLVAVAILAILLSLGIAALVRLARSRAARRFPRGALSVRIVDGRVSPSARIVEHRQAMWRLRC